MFCVDIFDFYPLATTVGYVAGKVISAMLL